MNAVETINKLSYSEQKAVKALFTDGRMSFEIVTSKVADSIGLSRSVIVNGLNKLNVTGMIESRSLGVKGTHIRVIDPGFLGAVKALEM